MRNAILIILATATFTASGVPLRDGSHVPKKQVNKVWNQLLHFVEIGGPFYSLWRATEFFPCNILEAKCWHDKKPIFPFCLKAGLCDKDGNVNAETWHIIRSSYQGGYEPKFYDMVYPINTFRHRFARGWNFLRGFSYYNQTMTRIPFGFRLLATVAALVPSKR
jgi:hypothetical protein